jgi:hypothetical protein
VVPLDYRRRFSTVLVQDLLYIWTLVLIRRLPILLHEITLHHLAVLLCTPRVQILAMRQKVFLVDKIIVVEARLLLVREFVLLSRRVWRLLRVARVVTPMP